MPTFSRRQALAMLAVTTAGGTLIPRAAFAQDATLMNADLCVITPEVTEGPYYFDPALERADITEGHPGLPTTLKLQVVDQSCTPLEGARVDVWHCDADGNYSGYNGYEGQTFMRGTQFTGADGMVQFTTVYPGWYRGRTTHIHFKVFLDTTTVLTGQIFFPDDISNAVYASIAPYSAHTGRDTFNDTDGIAQQAGSASVASVEQLPETYTAALIIGVDPNHVSEDVGFPGGPGPGGPPPNGMRPPANG